MPPKESVDLVIEPRWVLPIAPVNTVLTDHAVAVSAGRIVALAPIAEINARFEPRERVIRTDHALLPGFVNAHTRAATTLLRGLPVYGPRRHWMRETVLPVARTCASPDFVREGTQLAIAEMLRAGITAFADMYLFPEEAARVASAARMRAAIGLPVTDGPTAWAESATGHLAKAEQLWDEYQSNPWVSLYFAPHDAFGENDQTLARVRRVADELDARVAMYLAPGEVHVNHTGPRQADGRSPLVRLQELGLLGPGFTAVHLAGADEEELEIAASTGICVVACQQSHLRLNAALCPIGSLEARGVTVGLGTDSPLSVGALDVLGEARVGALVDGIADRARAGAYANTAGFTGDLFGVRAGARGGASGVGSAGAGVRGGAGGVGSAREVGAGARNVGSVGDVGAGGYGDAHGERAATDVSSVRDAGGAWRADARGYVSGGVRASDYADALGDAAALGALRRATLGGAAALGLSAVTGSIEPGKAADLVCINLSALSCQPNVRRPADALVFGATRNHVSDVWTSGRAAVSDGHLLTFDEQELLALSRRWATRLPTAGGS
jgi:5-methylthioadenosine/S-adenosylhomocysteine deaminase